MAPILHIGNLAIDAYILWRVLGILVVVFGLVLRLRSKRWPITEWDAILFVPFVQVGLLVGSVVDTALPYLVDHFVFGAVLPPGWWIGQRWIGAMGGAALAGYLFCRFRRLPIGRSFDLFAPLLPLGIAVARVGCLMRGCCHGETTTSWLGLFLPDIHGWWATRYPTQLASISANLLIFLLVVWLEHRANKTGRYSYDGFLFLLFTLLHCAQRFVFEFWRADTPHITGAFTWPQLYALIGIGIALGLMMRLRARQSHALPRSPKSAA
jgi:phosphatidylglycerol:prolipoprotein diacylglycerol transferase